MVDFSRSEMGMKGAVKLQVVLKGRMGGNTLLLGRSVSLQGGRG